MSSVRADAGSEIDTAARGAGSSHRTAGGTDPFEEWRPVVHFEGRYEVSDRGQVRSLPRTAINHRGVRRFVPGGILRPGTTKSGYRTVVLYKFPAPPLSIRIHRLVAQSFLQPPSPEQIVIRHLNGIPSDNRPENLAWGTPHENNMDTVRHGRHHCAVRTHCHRGHPFDEANTRMGRNPSGRQFRICRACERVEVNVPRHMSQVGKTRIKDHGLQGEGAYRYDDDGQRVTDRERILEERHALRAKCKCGALSPPGASQFSARKWHREHKNELRAGKPTDGDAGQ